ncbi:hypothetical protein D0C16_12980 [Cellvibrio sp. KY-GH-1]|uniref:hypothetical protein n=1 Tax=Cellvibrio sp. KY-GH-1 TaxID=2303332 RepID=UPI001245020A|nr:hypothetical protein [Cellvibrio sp. KY-GH-1]QEY16804.1 hypothetical protein D0C16_12980 [Cellvibrio sp. KY-GH-1]
MNHLVPEQMFSTETEKAQGISAVKAIAIASQQGQKIWTIDKTNVDLALSKMSLGASAESDIRNAVHAGQIATAHDSRINFNGWVGEGYILMDPNAGAGGYMISGGGNGSKTDVPDMLDQIMTDVSTIIDLLIIGLEKSKDIAIKTFKFILEAFSKALSFMSTALSVFTTLSDYISACPIEAIALLAPAFLFLIALSFLLITFLLSGFIAIIIGLLNGLLLSYFADKTVSACKGELIDLFKV